jgi:hypothetical protein
MLEAVREQDDDPHAVISSGCAASTHTAFARESAAEAGDAHAQAELTGASGSDSAMPVCFGVIRAEKKAPEPIQLAANVEHAEGQARSD